MANKEKQNNLPDCGCRGCMNLKSSRPRKYDCFKLDEASDKNSTRTRINSELRRASVECACGCKEQNVSIVRGNRGTFIKFTGPTNGASSNPTGSVSPSKSYIRSTSGCFLEKHTDEKSRGEFDLQNTNVSDNIPDEYFRSVTVWKGFLVKPVYVRARRTSRLAVQQTDSTNNGSLPSEYNFCNGRPPSEEKTVRKSRTFALHARPKVRTQIYLFKAALWHHSSEQFSKFSRDSLSTIFKMV